MEGACREGAAGWAPGLPRPWAALPEAAEESEFRGKSWALGPQPQTNPRKPRPRPGSALNKNRISMRWAALFRAQSPRKWQQVSEVPAVRVGSAV